MEKYITKDRIREALVVIKYLFSVYVTLMAFQTRHSRLYLICSLLELAGIIGISNLILMKNRWVGHGVHFLLLLIYNVQTLIVYFSGSFLSLIMLGNVVFIKDLQGKFLYYLKMIFPMLAVTCIPAVRLKRSRLRVVVLSALVLMGGVGILASKAVHSPTGQLVSLYNDSRSYRDMIKKAGSVDSDGTEFFKPEIAGYISKPDALPENPNVILIFAEGLSKNIIHDSRDIMPSLRQFEESSLSFENYYNHTFATLRGLIGQLYSGYQLENFDTNSLVSIQSVLKDKEYQTAFINTEPENKEFTGYLENLGFDEVLTDENRVNERGAYIHDIDAFELLYDTCITRHEAGNPFFTAVYTFGTHMSLDTADVDFDNGNDALLNRFYDLDRCFGAFLEKFLSGPLAEDTILVFTSDHATYADDDFLSAFPNYERLNPCLDQIPLCIFYDGIEPECVDAAGRNSLDLAPTLLDYMDVSAPNYFLGQSLFASWEEQDPWETVFHESASVLSTYDSQISQLAEAVYAEFRNMLIRYSCAKGVADIIPISEDQILIELSEDGAYMDVVLKTEHDYQNVWFPVWSDVDWQDDLVWHQAERSEDGSFKCRVYFSDHKGKGIYYVHAYQGPESPDELAAVAWIYRS